MKETRSQSNLALKAKRRRGSHSRFRGETQSATGLISQHFVYGISSFSKRPRSRRGALDPSGLDLQNAKIML